MAYSDGEFIPDYGYVIPAVIAVSDTGELFLKLRDGEDKWYGIGNIEGHDPPAVDQDEYDGDEWTKKDWEDWIRKTSAEIDKQECIGL